MWGQIERFTKVAAKRATTIGTFLEAFKRKMACETINPKWCEAGEQTITGFQDANGNIIVPGEQEKKRQFLTEVIEGGQDEAILYQLYKETARAVMLVRARLEDEKPIEQNLESIIEGEIVE
ncbi:hypothetical protein GCM10011391_28210 [Pullulanibacillus camelliae]|uniref:Uncharacterized protein n=1 Tax=Pullulanibacillus camelliae TaxID=1707096 RepID=A0A8J2YJX4_9BACL|nr:hypothetical protein [Pullulanibacillus camelliae]GGE47802.1 hypothetical protein GCM10011391_28210 [Pullulanibacillus camelliae]